MLGLAKHVPRLRRDFGRNDVVGPERGVGPGDSRRRQVLWPAFSEMRMFGFRFFSHFGNSVVEMLDMSRFVRRIHGLYGWFDLR